MWPVKVHWCFSQRLQGRGYAIRTWNRKSQGLQYDGFHLASNHFFSLRISRIINYKCIWKLNQGNIFQGMVIWSNLCQHCDEENLAIYIRSALSWIKLGLISWFVQQIHKYKSTVQLYLLPQITRTSSSSRPGEVSIFVSIFTAVKFFF